MAVAAIVPKNRSRTASTERLAQEKPGREGARGENDDDRDASARPGSLPRRKVRCIGPGTHCKCGRARGACSGGRVAGFVGVDEALRLGETDAGSLAKPLDGLDL